MLPDVVELIASFHLDGDSLLASAGDEVQGESRQRLRQLIAPGPDDDLVPLAAILLGDDAQVFRLVHKSLRWDVVGWGGADLDVEEFVPAGEALQQEDREPSDA